MDIKTRRPEIILKYGFKKGEKKKKKSFISPIKFKLLNPSLQNVLFGQTKILLRNIYIYIFIYFFLQTE